MYRFFLIIILLSTCCSPQLDAQNQKAAAAFKYYDSLYYARKISNPVYLDTIDSVLNVYPALDSLVEKLAIYQAIAWREDSAFEYKRRYWANLINNAVVTDKNGSLLYYVQKQISLAKLNLNSTARSKFYCLLLQCAMYVHNMNGNYQKCIALYQLSWDYLNSLPQLIVTNGINAREVLDAIHTILHAVYAYTKTGDTANVQKAVNRAETIYRQFLQYNKGFDEKQWRGYYLMLSMYSYQAEVYKDYKKEIVILEKSRQDMALVKDRSLPWVHFDPLTCLIGQVEACIDANQYDKAAGYLKLAKEQSAGNIYLQPDIASNESLIAAHNGNYKAAYTLSVSMLDTLKILNRKRFIEYSKLLDAFAESEEAQNQLQTSEKENKKLYKKSAYIFLLFTLLLLGGLLLMRHRSKKFRERIAQLNNAADIQVARLEEMTLEAHHIEQRRLGLELHDDIASELAALVFMTENQLQEANDPKEKERLKQTNTHLKNMYNRARKKSHELVNHSENVREEAFTMRTAIFLNNALSNKKYKKEILIDDNSLTKLHVEARIELLRIIQESIINILKHAKARSVSILIYEDKGRINLNIKDDGKGFDANATRKKGGLGLKSIKNRVVALDGELDIISGKDGTEISVSIPVS
jgi:signal transduction histidine kinase